MKRMSISLLRRLAWALAVVPVFFVQAPATQAETGPGFSAEHGMTAAPSAPVVTNAAVAAHHGEATGMSGEAHPAPAAKGGHEGHDGHGEAHASNPLAWPKVKDFIWRTLNFIALLALLAYFGGKPVINALRGRQERIAGELADLTAKRDAAEQSYREFTAKIAGMEKEMEQLVEQAVAQAQNEKARILAEAERAAGEIKRQAEAAVQAEVAAAKRRLREEVAEEAAKMAEDLIRQNLTEADHVGVIEQYLERVGAAQ